MKWTPEQKIAIDNRSQNMLVSAAAGSGKTAVLVERVIKMITDDQMSIDRILLVTFTNAAAISMKEKIHKEIQRQIHSDTEHRVFLRQQLQLLNRSHISTIHAFCFDVIRRFFFLLDIDPSFKVMDTQEAALMLEESVKEVLENLYKEGQSNFLRMITAFGNSRSDQPVVSLIIKTYHGIMSYPNPFDWFEQQIKLLEMNKEEAVGSVWMQLILEEYERMIDHASNLIQRAIDLCPEGLPYLEALIQDQTHLDDLRQGLHQDVIAFGKCLEGIKHSRLKAVKKTEKGNYDEETLEIIKKLRNDYKNTLDKLKKQMITGNLETLVDELNGTYDMMEMFSKILQQCHEGFRKKKSDSKVLDFNDAEHIALELLSVEEVKLYYKNKFKAIYIDEYQDSNRVQEAIIHSFAKENNVFLVGDIKQSIYRFRKAEPLLFVKRYDLYKNFPQTGKLVLLNRNFRSRKEILDFVNDIFKHLMDRKMGDIDYDEDAFLINGLEFPVNQQALELFAIDKTLDENETFDEALARIKNDEIEARFIGQKIKKIIGENWYDPVSNKEKQISFGDIVILLRAASNWSSVFEAVFYEMGIPFYSDVSNNYFETNEIKIILNVMALLDNEQQDIPLISVMRSMIGGFSLDDLIDIRANVKEVSFYEAVVSYDQEGALKKKIKSFKDNMARWKYQSQYQKLSMTLWQILSESGFYDYNGLLPNGSLRQGNLRLLIEQAEEFEENQFGGITNFIHYMSHISQNTKDFTSAKRVGENDDVVRLMTIHKSKGLEFPVVICGGLGKKFNQQDLYEPIMINSRCGVAPKYFDVENRIYKETIPRIASKIQVKKESMAEEMRVLYVAMTRAVHRLILVGTVKDYDQWISQLRMDQLDQYTLFQKNTYLDWISLIIQHQFKEKYPISKVAISNLIESNVQTTEAKKDQHAIHEIVPDQEIQKVFSQKYDWRYRHQFIEYLPGKVTVTDLKRLEADHLIDIRYKHTGVKRDIVEKGGFTGAEIGTLTHQVLQQLRLKSEIDQNYVKHELQRMVKGWHLREDEAQVVAVDDIVKFFSSTLGQRMLKSKKVFREQPFILKKTELPKMGRVLDQPVYVQGIIDAFFLEGEDLILIDYKTDRISLNDLNQYTHFYKDQVLWYKEALTNLTNKKVKEAYIVFLSLNQEVLVE